MDFEKFDKLKAPDGEYVVCGRNVAYIQQRVKPEILANYDCIEQAIEDAERRTTEFIDTVWKKARENNMPMIGRLEYFVVDENGIRVY